MNIDVFISHHTDSSLNIVEAIVNKMESNGIRCWYAPRDTQGAYASSIVHAINSCKVFLLILNKPASQSVHVLNELDMVTKRLSRNEEVSVIPFHIADDDISDDAQYYLGRLHWIDAITPPMENRILDLFKMILTILKRAPKDCEMPEQSGTAPLRSTPVVKNHDFVGREQELVQVHQFLMDDRIVFISGIGGTGKTELVNQYISKYRSAYRTIIVAKYESSLTDLIISEKNFYINNFGRNQLESDYDYAVRKLEKIKELTENDTLLVIDNFDTAEDELLEIILQGPYRIIFTTRMHFDYLGVPVMVLRELEHDKQVDLFKRNYKRQLNEQDLLFLDELLQLIQGHTLTIELIARLMDTKHLKIEAMLEQIKKAGISPEMTGVVRHKATKAQTVYSHIETLFDMESLSDEEVSIMQNLSLMPLVGVSFTNFMDWCHYDDGEIIHNLIERSWIKYDIEHDVISIHPVISDVVRSKVTDFTKSYGAILDEISQYFGFKRSWYMDKEERIEYGEIAKALYYKVLNSPYESFRWYHLLHPIFCNLDFYDLAVKTLKNMKGKIKEEESLEQAWFLYAVSDFCLRYHFFDDSLYYIQESITLMKRVSSDSFDLAYILKHAAHIYHAICKYFGVNQGYLKKAYVCLKECEQAYSISTSNSETQYGSIYYSYGLDTSKELESQAASRYYAFATNAYYRSEYVEALEYAEESYVIFLKINGELDSDTHAPMQLLALVYSKLDRLESAIDIEKRVINAREMLWGKDTFRYCDCLDVLANIYFEHGKIDEGLNQLNCILKNLKDKKDIYTNYIKTIEEKIKKYSSLL